MNPESVMDGEIGHIKKYCPKQSYRSPIVRGRGGHGRGRHSRGRGGRGNGGHQNGQGEDKWELLQRSLLEATGRQVIGPIVTLSLGG